MHTYRRAFTLLELLVVIAMLILLVAMLVPSMSAALEQSRITSCASVLHHIATAMETYVADNNNHFPYNAANNDFRQMIGSYLGLDQYLVTRSTTSSNGQGIRYLVYNIPGVVDSNGNPINNPWDHLKPFQCPSGAGLGTNARADGQQAVQGYWLSNWWISWNDIQNYYPNLQRTFRAFDTNINDYLNNSLGGPSHIGLLCEEWQVDTVGTLQYPTQAPGTTNITYAVVASNLAQPYSTHYRYGSMGVMGIGRNMLFADWHIKFRKCNYSASTDGSVDTTYWSDSSASAVQIPTTYVNRGNECGESFQIQTKTGATYWGWRPTLNDPDMAYWWAAQGL